MEHICIVRVMLYVQYSISNANGMEARNFVFVLFSAFRLTFRNHEGNYLESIEYSNILRARKRDIRDGKYSHLVANRSRLKTQTDWK